MNVRTTPSITPTAMAYAPNAAPNAADQMSTDGGGSIGDALSNGVARIAAFAQKGITSIQDAIQGEMNSSGTMDPAKMQQYTMRMSSYEQMMQMAAKIQEKQEAATEVWLRQ